MQLILLSGGSGRRLWPISNDKFSKQFIKLLRGECGQTESMIQRVVRQIRLSSLFANSEDGAASGKTDGTTGSLTFATNIYQKDIIINQIGESVGIVCEPERRNTFPAIALATAYLSLEKHCCDDEVVVVMPCDVYTEAGYFETLAKMAREVEKGSAELVLMGIKPDSPSSKFGYIVPSDSDALEKQGVCRVERFTEKPTREKAEELLRKGALWNGGVFAFRLGYLREISGKYCNAADFESFRDSYQSLPKISFDYEVVEKAQSVAVVSYQGKWQDIGTWNALCEELPGNSVGNVLMGPGCENTHAVNTLGIPMYCEGVRDVVVAASPDGILVCGKEASEGIKDKVEQIITAPKYEPTLWGSRRELDASLDSSGIMTRTCCITIEKGKSVCWQSSAGKTSWTVVQGSGTLTSTSAVVPSAAAAPTDSAAPSAATSAAATFKAGMTVNLRAGEKYQLSADLGEEIRLIELKSWKNDEL